MMLSDNVISQKKPYLDWLTTEVSEGSNNGRK